MISISLALPEPEEMVHHDLDDVSPIDTSCEAIKHQSTIARFGDSLDKKGIGITPDPFGAGAYNL